MTSSWMYRVGFAVGILGLVMSPLASGCKGQDCADERVGEQRCVGNRLEICGSNNMLSYDSCTSHPGLDKYCSAVANACVTKEIYDAQTGSTTGAGGSMMTGAGGMHAGAGGMHAGAGGTSTTMTSSAEMASSSALSSSATGGGDITKPLNGCDPATLLDYTLNPSPAVTFPGTGLEYTPSCIKIKVGQSVLFLGTNATFVQHPLSGGLVQGNAKVDDPTSPIKKTSTGQNATFAFPATGAFGFFCDYHFPAGMKGAVYVVP